MTPLAVSHNYIPYIMRFGVILTRPSIFNIYFKSFFFFWGGGGNQAIFCHICQASVYYRYYGQHAHKWRAGLGGWVVCTILGWVISDTDSQHTLESWWSRWIGEAGIQYTCLRSPISCNNNSNNINMFCVVLYTKISTLKALNMKYPCCIYHQQALWVVITSEACSPATRGTHGLKLNRPNNTNQPFWQINLANRPNSYLASHDLPLAVCVKFWSAGW